MELYKPICTVCDERGEYTLATETYWGEDYCENCLTHMAEAAHERSLSDFYGGSGCVTFIERCDAAARERAELRRRD